MASQRRELLHQAYRAALGDFGRPGRLNDGLEGKAGLTSDDLAGPQPHIFNSQPGKRIGNQAARHLQAYGGTDAIDWVMDCVSLRARTAASAGFEFNRNGKRYVPKKGPTDPKHVGEADSTIVELMREPNPWFTYNDLLQLLVIDLMLVGNGFWLKFRPDGAGKPLSLYRLAPPLVTVIPGTERLIDAYEYKVPGSEPVRFAPEDVIHFREPNPHSPYLGLGLIAGGPRVYDIELNLVESQSSYFGQGTKLSGIITSDRQVPPKVMQKIKRTWANLYGSPSNAGLVAVLERGMQFKTIQSNAQEAAFEPLANLSRDRICAMTGTPLPLLGILDNRINPVVMREVQRVYDTKTMRPMLDRIEERISIDLTSAWNYDFVIPYEYKMPPEDAVDLATGVATLPGVRIREVREFAGLDPLGDERDEIVLNLPGQNDNASKVKDRNLPHEPGRPPNPENTAAVPEPGAPLPADAAVAAPPGMGRRSRRVAQAKAFLAGAELEELADG